MKYSNPRLDRAADRFIAAHVPPPGFLRAFARYLRRSLARLVNLL
jgi:hypothetical protein